VATTTIARDAIESGLRGSRVSAARINVPFCHTEAYAAFGVKCIVARGTEQRGSLATIRIRVPDGSIPERGAPPGRGAPRRRTNAARRDLRLPRAGAPGGVPAEGASCNWTLYLFGGPGRVNADPATLAKATPFSVLASFGGMGARPTKTASPRPHSRAACAILRSRSPGAISPIVVWRRSPSTLAAPGVIAASSARRWSSRTSTAPFTLSPYYDRIAYPARGRDGGHEGAPGEVRLAAGTALRGKGLQTIPAGERVVFAMPGGGGYGDPWAVIRRRLRPTCGRVSLGGGRADGLRRRRGRGRRLDEAATARLRDR
jgi:N-methylhydantoinase B